MKRVCIVIVFLLALSSTASARGTGERGGGMSDVEVVEFVRRARAEGRTQGEVAAELARRGVGREQAARISRGFGGGPAGAGQFPGQASGLVSGQSSGQTDGLYVRRFPGEAAGHGSGVSPSGAGNVYPALGGAFAPDFGDRSHRVSPPGREQNIYGTQYQRDTLSFFEDGQTAVYGRDIFTNPNLSFAPSQYMATPEDYRLGPGDEVIIDIWGASQTIIRETLSPEGCVNISGVGPVCLAGMTVREAETLMRRRLEGVYSGLAGERPTSEIMLSVGRIRTVQINVMGEVAVPGTYSLSSLSTVMHALYAAGGTSSLGSLRDIRLVRGGRVVATLDVYQILRSATQENPGTGRDIRLEDGDIIIVPPYGMLADISGRVKRPMYYELKDGETAGDLIALAGGPLADAYTGNVRVVRRNGARYQIFTVEGADLSSFRLMDGDALTVGAMPDRFENRVEITGAVLHPGVYQLGTAANPEIAANPGTAAPTTVRELVARAGGLTEDAFPNRALLYRERPDLSPEIMPVSIRAVADGTAPDIALRPNDILHIPAIQDLYPQGDITVFGEVTVPGTYPFAENTTLEDLIIQAGGLLESASTARVDITRRIRDNSESASTDAVGESYSFSIKDGLVIDGRPGFILQPYDQVYVRKSPSYRIQANVSVYGEVLFEGDYSLTLKSERLSDLIAKAGGLTSFAYAKGARLLRRVNAEERRRMQRISEVAKGARDSISTDGSGIGDTYYVGIDLASALSAPGSDADIVLREGDTVYIPEMDNTVRISGTVLYPNTVAFEGGMGFKYYIGQAGGYAYRAKKNRIYIVYMNGQVSKAGRMRPDLIQPGCEIVVPSKPERNWTLQNTLSIATTSASLATMIATIGNLLN